MIYIIISYAKRIVNQFYTYSVYNWAMKPTLKFSENLKVELKNNHFSQERLAKELGTTQATISRWISGENQPDLETVMKICEIFDTTPNLLLGWED